MSRTEPGTPPSLRYGFPPGNSQPNSGEFGYTQLAPRDIKILQNCSSLVSRSFVKIGAARHDAGCVSPHGGLILAARPFIQG